MYKKLACLLVILLNTSCSLQNIMSPGKNVKLDSLNEEANYYSYLQQITKIQEKYPLKDRNTLNFKVAFHTVRPLQNTTLGKEDYALAISYMNSHFKEVGIQFKEHKDPQYLFSSAPVDAFFYNRSLEKEFIKKSYDPSVLNIYVVENSKDVVGFTHYPIDAIQSLFIAKEKLIDPSLIHEIGHFFGLLHTFENSRTRNAASQGDMISDTPSDIDGASFVEADCSLHGEYKDENGMLYKPDLRNFMSYYGNCRSRFSPQQINRMYFIAKNIKLPQMRTNV